MIILRSTVLLATLCFLTSPLRTFGSEIIPRNSDWGFRSGTSEASSPISDWRDVDFDDSEFTRASAPFWYGDSYPGGTQLVDMQGSYTCFFLRQTFVIKNVHEIRELQLKAFIDDGFIAWINGTEVRRFNVSTGEPTVRTLASNAAEPPPLNTYRLSRTQNYLVEGINVLAVQVFNTSATSSDIGFDCSLQSIRNESIPPIIEHVTPPPGTVSDLTSVTVTFSEPVTGIQADDLVVNGIRSTAVNGDGATYEFRFAQPSYGTVSIAWNSRHGIMDTALSPNRFSHISPDSRWQYELLDEAPPFMASLHPPIGATLRTLSQIEVDFSEQVIGVQASDLVINGQLATDLIQQPNGRFVFRFPLSREGSVEVAWADDHNITDAAARLNPFSGGTWSYVVDPGAPIADLAISEILASNVRRGGLIDEDRQQQDWIEIHNQGTHSVNLENWSLSDDADIPGLWAFPARTLAPNEYLIVYASGKDRSPTASTDKLHTNFKLGNSGEHLGLYSPDSPRALISGFTPYPEQRNDTSYGVDFEGSLRYFAIPTPSQPNGRSTIAGVCEPVHTNVRRGHFDTPFDLTVSSKTTGAVIRYTIDGSEPNSTSEIFPSSLRVTRTTLFRAAAFKESHLPSKSITHSYFFNVPENIRSLPTISIVTATNHLFGRNGILGINGGNYNNGPWAPNRSQQNQYHNPSRHGLAWERPTSVEWIHPEDNSGFQVDCGIRVHGSDYNRPRIKANSKISFRLYFRGDYGPGRLEYPLFPLTSVRRFDQLVLRAGFNEQNNPFIRDEIHRRLSSDMGHIASHGTLAVVFINGVYHAASPWYNPCERVHEEFMQEHLGGGDKWDVVGPSFAQSSGAPGVVDGNRRDFLSMVSYVGSRDVTNPSIYRNIGKFLDLTNFVDYCLLNAYSAMGDWPPNNWRAGKDRSTNGPWRFLVWDAEWGMGIYDRTVNINSFTERGGGPNDSGLGSVNNSEIARIYDRLRASPEFRLLWADRVQKHFFNGGALTQDNITMRFNELRDELRPLIRNMNTEILTWARRRQSIFFRQMRPFGLLAAIDAPAFSQFGGRVPVGFRLALSHVSGSIYYTTDGTDPRVPFTGIVSTTASEYTEQVSITTSVTVKARVLRGTTWSALTEATFLAGSLGVPIRISEIMHNPTGGSLHEFIELLNTSDTLVDLSGLYFDGIQFRFNEGSVLTGGERLVLGSDKATNSWNARYPDKAVAGWFDGSLNNSGERISLLSSTGRVITSVNYSTTDGWPAPPDNGGTSLELINPSGNLNAPANWQLSGLPAGTPGFLNSQAPKQAVYLNEIMADNVAAVENGGVFPDWIEIRNSSNREVDLAGWSLTDDDDQRKFVFPPGTTLPPSGYQVVWCDNSDNESPGLHAGFKLNSDGESVILYDSAGIRADAVTFGLQIADYTIGRMSGEWILTTPTPNVVNVEAPLASTVNLTINEWLANPAPGDDDWVELFNLSEREPVSLQGIYIESINGTDQLQTLSYIAPRGFVQLIADSSMGPRHVNIRFPADGGHIALYDASGGELQTVEYGEQSEGVSEGRLPDGDSEIIGFDFASSPGSKNYTPTYQGPLLNEVLARNRSVPVMGKVTDFIEIYNPDSVLFDLGGMSVSVDDPNPGQWSFPPNTVLEPNGHLLILCDASQPFSETREVFNIGEALDGNSGGVSLYDADGRLVDSIRYGFQIDDLSIGLSAGRWNLLTSPSPGTANERAMVLGPNTNLLVNEWMADPLKNLDWFEIHNTADHPVDLSTVSLSDDPSIASQGKFRPAPLSFVAASGFIKWVADGRSRNGRNHVNFALDKAGDSILIYGISGSNYRLIDGVGFGAQIPGLSEGNWPDGSDFVIAFPNSSTPGATNTRISIETDTDRDGIPDAIEIELKLNPNDPTDGIADTDRDGATNAQEYAAGTDHLDPESTFEISEITIGAITKISFHAAANRTYSVHFTDSLQHPIWRTLTDIEGMKSGQTVSVTDPQGGISTRFYRLVTPSVQP